MTDSTRLLRERRSPSLEHVPDELAKWFRGEVSDCWFTILPNDVDLLPARWRTWKAAHPDARPPDGFAWLDDLRDPRHPTDEQVRAARLALMRRAVR